MSLCGLRTFDIELLCLPSCEIIVLPYAGNHKEKSTWLLIIKLWASAFQMPENKLVSRKRPLEIFKQKLNGMSSQRIASHLNELGVLPPNEYKRANGFNYTCGFQAGLNQKWTVVSVNRILKNESYTGTLIQGKRRKINYKVRCVHRKEKDPFGKTCRIAG